MQRKGKINTKLINFLKYLGNVHRNTRKKQESPKLKAVYTRIHYIFGILINHPIIWERIASNNSQSSFIYLEKGLFQNLHPGFFHHLRGYIVDVCNLESDSNKWSRWNEQISPHLNFNPHENLEDKSQYSITKIFV